MCHVRGNLATSDQTVVSLRIVAPPGLKDMELPLHALFPCISSLISSAAKSWYRLICDISLAVNRALRGYLLAAKDLYNYYKNQRKMRWKIGCDQLSVSVWNCPHSGQGQRQGGCAPLQRNTNLAYFNQVSATFVGRRAVFLAVPLQN